MTSARPTNTAKVANDRATKKTFTNALMAVIRIRGLTGMHPRQRSRVEGTIYVAGIDYAGQDEQLDGLVLTRPQRDATVIKVLVAPGDRVEPKDLLIELG